MNTRACFKWRDAQTHLHEGVVEGDEGREQVQIASGEHQSKQNLTLPRYP